MGGEHQTVACVTTPLGEGGISVVEVHGPKACEVVNCLFRGNRPLEEPPACALHADRRRLYYGKLYDGKKLLDEVMVQLVPAEESFTGESAVDICCHGGIVPVQLILRALEERGVVRIDTAALTHLAFQNGKLDGIQVEAHQALREATTEYAALTLYDQTQGALSRAIRAIRSCKDTERLLETAPLGMALATPPRVVIVGETNVGKSTLFNALVERDRVVVHPTPGTTRDPVSELIAIDGVPFRLVDTAGLRETQDTLEKMSIERTEEEVAHADLVIELREGRDERLEIRDFGSKPYMLVLNKCDLLPASRKERQAVVCISALKGTGISDLKRAILAALKITPSYTACRAVIFTLRQKRLLEQMAHEKSAEAMHRKRANLVQQLLRDGG